MHRITLLLLALAVPLGAAARPTVVVDAPDFRPLPLALPAFLAEGEGRAAEETLEVLRADLALSGLFELLDPKGFLAEPGEGLAAPSIKFGRWATVGAEGLVKARVRREGAGLSADLRLHEVRAGREVLQRQLSAPDPRALAHRMADELVRFYTGEPGVFRTHIAAVRRTFDGRRDRFELVLLDADGRNPRVLTGGAALLRLPAWHPDGDRILVSRQIDQNELWVYRLSDRSFNRLSVGREAYAGAFSPDGTRLAFTGFDDKGNSHVWVADADGKRARPLTSAGTINVSPSWSPDGKRIAFNSDRTGRPHIFVMNADGGEQRRLTFQGENNTTPKWSPRGDLIAYTARDERLAFDLFAISPETGKSERITQDAGPKNEEPTWAPTGRMIAFTRDRGQGPQLVISDAKGERPVPIPGAEVSTPAWGPLPKE
jgi:TolB protein